MKRQITTYCLLVLFLGKVFAAPKIKWNAAFQAYFDKYKELAITEMHKYGIPASITLAQGALESGAGKSKLAVLGNNHFGIKCHGWQGRSIAHDDDFEGECFRAYDSVFESYEDHSLFLAKRSHYSALFKLSREDYRGWAHGLKEAGYATDPSYAQKLINIIELYGLYEYDTAPAPKRRPQPTNESINKLPNENNLHSLKAYNKNFYIIAQTGDTFESLAKEFETSARKLAKYNERKKKDRLQAGEPIWLLKKQRRAPKAFKNRPHVVKVGESLYSIAQTYGIRLESLIEKNPQINERGVNVGEKIRIY